MADTDALLGISPDPVRFDEAIAAIRRKVPMTEDVWSELEQEELEFAFTVADVAQLDLVVDVYEAIDRAVRDGTTLEGFKADVGDGLEDAWGEENPARIEAIFRTNVMCILPGQTFEGAPIAGSQARYSGEILQLKTESGRHLALTANHPVLTDHGFVPANSLRHGDNLISHGAGIHHLSLSAEKAKQHDPTPVEDVFRSLAGQPSRRMRRRLGPFDLHGDAKFIDGQVDIVRTNRALLGNLHPPASERRSKLVLGLTTVKHPGLNGHRPGDLLGLRDREMTKRLQSFVKPRRPELLFFGRERHPFRGPSSRRRAPRHAVAFEQIVDLVKRKIGLGRNHSHRFSLLVEFYGRALNMVRYGSPQPDRFGAASYFDVRKPKATRDSGRTHAEFIRQMRNRSAGQVTFDKLIEVGNQQLRSHVFDFETITGWYSVGGIVVSNCAYNSGRYEAAQQVKDTRPYWRFDGPDDSRTSEEICRPCIGVILPADHPWWQHTYPPLHVNCRHRASSLTKEQAEDQGITESPPHVEVPAGFGMAPSGGGGSDWAPDPDDYPDELASALEDRIDEDAA